jgi:peptidylprolyl isomerase
MRFAFLRAAVCAVALAAGVHVTARTAAVAPPSEADWRTPDPQNVLVIDTSKGRIFVELAPQVAPATAARVRDLARSGFYDGRIFFRVIDGFMDQTGDPQDNGQGGSTQPNVPPEFTFRRGASTPMVTVGKINGLETGFIGSLPILSQSIDLAVLTADDKVRAWGTFCPGVAGMARADAPDSGNSQFFLMRDSHSDLDQHYTPFGRAIGGLDVIRAIKTGEPPAPPMDTMTKVRVLADIPPPERPTVRVIDPAGPWFRAMVERVRVQKVIDFSVCDLDVPSQIK